MKKLLIVVFLLILTTGTNAQLSTIKAGGNFNADIASHKLGKVNYQSWEISFERALCKKFSINATLNYAKRDVRKNIDFYNNVQVYGNYRWKTYHQTLIIEARYYLKTNSSGLFFNVGIPFTYSTEKSYAHLLTGESNRKVYSYAISTIGGLGIKYLLSSKFGVEMNISVSPSYNFLGVDYGTSGFIKSGVKLFYALDKSKM